MLAHLYYYAKAVVAALTVGAVYLTTVIGPDVQVADLGHVSLLHWLGFATSVLGAGGLTAVVTNGPAPVKGAKAPDATATASWIPGTPATTRISFAAPASSFADTQAKLDALPAEVTPVYGETTPTA